MSIQIAIAWCIAWGETCEPTQAIEADALRQAICQGKALDTPQLQEVLNKTKSLLTLFTEEDEGDVAFPKTRAELDQLVADYKHLPKIGLVYGGVTKVKSYVFESADLHEIRGASSLLDRINLVDLPAFFKAEDSDLKQFEQCQNSKEYCRKTVRKDWLDSEFEGLSNALIPELIVYSTGGNILAFCPVYFVDQLANAIEKRYTEETLTANSCAVGQVFHPLETRLGKLPSKSQGKWLDWYLAHPTHPLLSQLLGLPNEETPDQAKITSLFQQQKSFSELVSQLGGDFERRRSGYDANNSRPSRRYPPMFETHPYLRRDGSEARSAVFQAESPEGSNEPALPNEPWFSETSARKRLVGFIAKRELEEDVPTWWKSSGLEWPSVVEGDRYKASTVESWVKRFEKHIFEKHLSAEYYPEGVKARQVSEARSLREIADSFVPHSTPASGFVAFIYADGNNMGGYIRRKIQSPQQYQQFSQDVFKATEGAVYKALKQLKPRRYKPDTSSSRKNKKETWLYPFEVVAVGGDDVMLVVPADAALSVAETLGNEFERLLGKCINEDGSKRYGLPNVSYNPRDVHRCQLDDLPSGQAQCELSMSAGVLIAAQNTPFYYAEELTQQLMKSAKQRAKKLRKKNYYGGTVDFLVMKSVTMISSNVKQFRKQGLVRSEPGRPTLKQYAAPYTLYELGELLKTAQALKGSGFPRSQLYQIRSLLTRGKQTAILNYRYFRLRLNSKPAQEELETLFEKGWCTPKENGNKGNLAPWMSYKEKDPDNKEQDKTAYETIWRELVDLYPFITAPSDNEIRSGEKSPEQSQEVTP